MGRHWVLLRPLSDNSGLVQTGRACLYRVVCLCDTPPPPSRHLNRIARHGGTVRGPRGVRGGNEFGQVQKGRVVIDPPSAEVPPSLIAVGLERDPGRRQSVVCLFEFEPRNSNRVGGLWVPIEFRTEEGGDSS